jgi:Carboxypeptidase regulatory-like domain
MGLRRTLLWPLLATGLLASGCVEKVPGAEYDLTGYVLTRLDRAPIAGAMVRFTSDTGTVTEATTNGDGRYAMQVFSDVAFGQVRAEATGFAPHSETVYFDQPQRRADLALEALER